MEISEILVCGGGIFFFLLCKLTVPVVLTLAKRRPRPATTEPTTLIPKPRKLEPLKRLPPCYIALYVGLGLMLMLPLLRRKYIVAAVVFMCMSALCTASFTDPGKIPEDPMWDYGNAAGIPSFILERKKIGGNRRHCKWCGLYKPDRCHHCRVCKVCILGMDHHMPWIYNCIGFRNYRFFVQFLYYGTMALILVWTEFFAVFGFVSDETQNPLMRSLVLAAGIGAAFDGVLLGMFLFFHFYLILKRMTTIEFCEKSQSRKLESKFGSNIKKQWGYNPLKWLLPIAPPLAADGCSFVLSDSVTSPN